MYRSWLMERTLLSDKTSLEAGYAGEFNHGDYDFTVKNLMSPQQAWEIDPAKTNRFIVDQAIHASYATLRHTFGKIDVLAGLRVE
jgi:predicted dehydrogenase